MHWSKHLHTTQRFPCECRLVHMFFKTFLKISFCGPDLAKIAPRALELVYNARQKRFWETVFEWKERGHFCRWFEDDFDVECWSEFFEAFHDFIPYLPWDGSKKRENDGYILLGNCVNRFFLSVHFVEEPEYTLVYEAEGVPIFLENLFQVLDFVVEWGIRGIDHVSSVQ